MINTHLNKAASNQSEISYERSFKRTQNRNNVSSQQSEISRKERDERRTSVDLTLDNIFTDEEDARIDDKYYNEVINKNCYSIKEVNEKMIVVNENTQNLISTVLESTFSNIISEAIFGETDLTEQTKIFFYKKN